MRLVVGNKYPVQSKLSLRNLATNFFIADNMQINLIGDTFLIDSEEAPPHVQLGVIDLQC